MRRRTREPYFPSFTLVLTSAEDVSFPHWSCPSKSRYHPYSGGASSSFQSNNLMMTVDYRYETENRDWTTNSQNDICDGMDCVCGDESSSITEAVEENCSHEIEDSATQKDWYLLTGLLSIARAQCKCLKTFIRNKCGLNNRDCGTT